MTVVVCNSLIQIKEGKVKKKVNEMFSTRNRSIVEFGTIFTEFYSKKQSFKSILTDNLYISIDIFREFGASGLDFENILWIAVYYTLFYT